MPQMLPLERPDDPKPPANQSPLQPLPLLIAVIVVLAAVYWFLIAPRIRPSPISEPEAGRGVGKAMAYLELRPLTGDAVPVSLGNLKNHVTLLNFWGPWCPACRNELPHIAKLRRRFAGQDTFRLLAISCPAGGQATDVQSLQEETAALLKQFNLDLPTYYDPDSATLSAIDQLITFEGYPTTILLDRRGVIRAAWVGYRPGAETEMERHIGMVLEEGKK
jgi:thiol-disulfide isomerase/thioredoxin